MQKSRLTYFSAIVLTAAVLAGCSDKPADQGIDGTPTISGPATEKVAARSHVAQVNLPGGAKIEGYESARLYAKVSGYLRDVRRVARGEIRPAGKTDSGVIKIQVSDSWIDGRPIEIQVILIEAADNRITRFGLNSSFALKAPAVSSDQKEPPHIPKLRRYAERFCQQLYEKPITKTGAAMTVLELPAEIDIGMEIESGTVLAVLDVPEMVAELAEKQAAFKEATQEKNEKDALAKFYAANYKDYQALKESGATTKELLDKAEAQNAAAIAAVATAKARIETAQANVKVAQAMAGYAKITAPFSGRITGRMVHRGTFIRSASKNSNAQPLFDIVRFDKVRVIASVPGSLAPLVVLGEADAELPTAELHSLNGYPGVVLSLGKVTRSAISLDPDSHAMRVEIDVTNPVKDLDGRERSLQHGMFGTLRLTTARWDEEKNPLSVVRVTAVKTDDDGRSYVMAVGKGTDAKYKKRQIKIIFNNAIEVGFETGDDKKKIAPGDEVVAVYDITLDGKPVVAPAPKE